MRESLLKPLLFENWKKRRVTKSMKSSNHLLSWCRIRVRLTEALTQSLKFSTEPFEFYQNDECQHEALRGQSPAGRLPFFAKAEAGRGRAIVRRVVELESLRDEFIEVTRSAPNSGEERCRLTTTRFSVSAAYEKRGFAIDARLFPLATGWELASKFNKAANSA